MFACTVSREQAAETPQPYYDPGDGLLDLGYRDLRSFDPSQYLDGVQDPGQMTITLTPRVQTLSRAGLGRVLTRLLISHNSLRQLPAPETMPYLRYLDVSSNQLTAIPHYPRLGYLLASDNQIASLLHYPGLRILDLSRNPVRELPRRWEGRQLSLAECGLTESPIQTLSVEVVDLSDNPLSSLPPLTEVVDLDIRRTRIARLGPAPRLTHLQASGSRLASVEECPVLRSLRADDCPLPEITSSTLQRLWMWTPEHLDCPALRELSLQPQSLGRPVSGAWRLPALLHYQAPGCAIRELPEAPHLRTADLQGSGLQRAVLLPGLEQIDLRRTPLERLVVRPRETPLVLHLDWAAYRTHWRSLDIQHLLLHLDRDRLLRQSASTLTQDERTRVVQTLDGLRPDQVTQATRRAALYLVRHRHRLQGYRHLQEVYQSPEYAAAAQLVTRLYRDCVWVEVVVLSRPLRPGSMTAEHRDPR